jgi:pentatricopeptide repeat protein
MELILEYGASEQIGNQEQAMTIIQELLQQDPDNAAALNYIGYTWAERGENLDQALAYIERAVAVRPEDGFIRDSLGWVYFKLGRLERAVAEMEKAIELVSDDPIIHEHMDVYLKAGEVDKARAAYEKAMEHQQEPDKKAAVARKLEALPTGVKK